MLARTASMNDRVAMYNDNALKIGLFGANCSSGRSATTVPERWSASWEDCLALAKLGDEAGLDFMLPIARWKGYGGITDFHGATLETITWAVGLLCATKRMTVFGTVHAPLFHPLIAAKEFVTADHIGQGRVGVNIVVGWNEGEFDMFGVQQREHDMRYDYAQEWVDIVKQAWQREDTFDFNAKFFDIKAARAFPKPYGGNAAADDERGLVRRWTSLRVTQLRCILRGERRNAAVACRKRSEGRRGQDCRKDSRPRHRTLHRRTGDLPPDTKGSRRLLSARQHRQCRLGRHRRHAGEQEHDAADHAPEGIRSQTPLFRGNGRRRLSLTVGTPDKVADELATISQAGMHGIGLSFVNFLNEVPYFCDEVLPRLERKGVRVKR